MSTPALTVAFYHAVAVIAHVTEELDLEKNTLKCIFMSNISVLGGGGVSLPGCNEFHSTPTLFSRNADDRGTAFRTWRTQNANKNNKTKPIPKAVVILKGITQGRQTAFRVKNL